MPDENPNLNKQQRGLLNRIRSKAAQLSQIENDSKSTQLGIPQKEDPSILKDIRFYNSSIFPNLDSAKLYLSKTYNNIAAALLFDKESARRISEMTNAYSKFLNPTHDLYDLMLQIIGYSLQSPLSEDDFSLEFERIGLISKRIRELNVFKEDTEDPIIDRVIMLSIDVSKKLQKIISQF